jgi:hypothetical protein
MRAELIVATIGVVASLLAAYWWLRASLVEVPDNVDTFIGELQKASRLSAYGAKAAVVAALCAAYAFVRQSGWL